MTSWFKAAEDLFEVVDRRAKLVVSELADEQSDNQSPASNGQGSQGKKKKSRAKAQKRLSTNEISKTSDIVQEQTSTQLSESDATPAKDGDAPSLEIDGTTSSNSMPPTNNEQQGSVDKEISVTGVPLTEIPPNETVNNELDVVGVAAAFTVPDTVTSNSNGELVKENAFDAHEDPPPLPLPLPATGVNVDNEDHVVEAVAAHNIGERDADDPLDIDQEKSHSLTDNASNNNDTQSKHSELKAEHLSEEKMHQEHEAITPKKVQEQLEEAQGLLKSTNTTGQSKEARLARVCAGLSSRLQEYKSENSQLEELLTAERELSKSYEARIKQLQRDLSVSKMEVTRVESNMAEALTAKNSEIEALVSSVDVLKKQTALSEGNLASLQVNMESLMRNRELTETRMMQALREELATAERRAEEERIAHNATKMAAREREVELEHRAVDASTALARIQRVADERTSKAAELEQKVALLEVECASLNQELQDMESRVRRGQKKSPEEANQVIQAWQEEVERARQGQRDAEGKLSSLEAEVQKMRVEMAAMKRDAEHYSRQEHMELEKRYRELTDLLYYKQTQLESMASEKAAAEFQLEKEIKRGQDTQVEAERIRASRRTSSTWEEDTDLKALEPLPLHHRHMVGASVQLQKAAKILDTGAVRATRFLWRYPTARIILLFYLVFVHLFLMYLLHRLQEQADSLSSREVAESMGLSVPTLP